MLESIQGLLISVEYLTQNLVAILANSGALPINVPDYMQNILLNEAHNLTSSPPFTSKCFSVPKYFVVNPFCAST